MTSFSLPDTVVCDLDGTLCDTRHRAPILQANINKQYDDGDEAWVHYSMLCIHDTLVEGVARMLEMFDCRVVLATGRRCEAEENTRRWLSMHGIKYNRLIMRGAGDHRSNRDFKTDVVRGEIDEGHRVKLMIDDHPGVIAGVMGEFRIPGLLVSSLTGIEFDKLKEGASAW